MKDEHYKSLINEIINYYEKCQSAERQDVILTSAEAEVKVKSGYL